MGLWREGGGTHRLEWTLLTLRQLCFEKECRSRVMSEMLKATNTHSAAGNSQQPSGQKEAGPVNALQVLESIMEIDPPSELERTQDTGGSLGRLASNLMEQMRVNVQQEEHSSEGKWVMISYNWDVQKEAKELCSELQSNGYVVWMDILDGCMAGDTLEAMANAVGKAAVVIILVTYKYKQSANCRREASYAQDLRKVTVPVIMEPGYKPNTTWGWLGLVIAGKKTYDFGKENPDRKEQLRLLLSSPELEKAPRVSAKASSVSALATTAMHMKRTKLRAMNRIDAHDVRHHASTSDAGSEDPLTFVRSKSTDVRRVSMLRMSRVLGPDGEYMSATDQESSRTRSSGTNSPFSSCKTDLGEEPAFLSLRAGPKPNPYDFAPFHRADSAQAVLTRKGHKNMSFVLEDSRENSRSGSISREVSSREIEGVRPPPLSAQSEHLARRGF